MVVYRGSAYARLGCQITHADGVEAFCGHESRKSSEKGLTCAFAVLSEVFPRDFGHRARILQLGLAKRLHELRK